MEARRSGCEDRLGCAPHATSPFHRSCSCAHCGAHLGEKTPVFLRGVASCDIHVLPSPLMKKSFCAAVNALEHLSCCTAGAASGCPSIDVVHDCFLALNVTHTAQCRWPNAMARAKTQCVQYHNHLLRTDTFKGGTKGRKEFIYRYTNSYCVCSWCATANHAMRKSYRMRKSSAPPTNHQQCTSSYSFAFAGSVPYGACAACGGTTHVVPYRLLAPSIRTVSPAPRRGMSEAPLEQLTRPTTTRDCLQPQNRRELVRTGNVRCSWRQQKTNSG